MTYSISTRMRSGIAGIDWPPVAEGQAAVLATMLYQLEDTERMPASAVTARQYRQLQTLADHCVRHSAQFQRRLHKAGITADELGSPEGLRRLPVLSRRKLQTGAGLFCAEVPTAHLPVNETRTSGSTGEPVTVRRTAINNFDWLALTMRDHLWHGRDFSQPFCAVRANIGAVARREDWGPPASLLFETGPSLGIPITTDTARQIDLIRDFAPESLLIYPSSLAALVRECASRNLRLPSLKHIRTMGETLSQHLREEAQTVLGAIIADCYSSQEVGYIALQCPLSGLYHVMSETLIVEVLNEAGDACREGETGRVTITDLHNFATPLIRYDISDYAEVGPDCPCGRSLPTLRRILGRERNLILMPDGTRHWPLVGFDRFRDIAPVVQYQLIQDGRRSIELRLVAERTLSSAEERALSAHVQEALGYEFAIRIVYFDGAIPPDAGGKFEEFVCRL